MDNSILSTVFGVGQKYGVPPEILYAVGMTESGFNPNAHALTSKEDSRGIFQVNVKAHPDANSGMLFNPEYNANYIMPTLASAYNEGKNKGLSGSDLAVYVERYGERPAWNSTVENKVRSNYSAFISNPSLNTLGTKDTSSNVLTNVASTTTGNIIQSGIDTALPYIKFGGVYILIFIILIIAIYISFVNKGGSK